MVSLARMSLTTIETDEKMVPRGQESKRSRMMEQAVSQQPRTRSTMIGFRKNFGSWRRRRRYVRSSLQAVIDQCHEGEVPALGQAQIDEHFKRVRMLKGSFLVVDSEPTNDQISAMRSRVVDQGLAPYADFAVFVPFGLRFAKLLRYQSHVLQSDGNFLTIEAPGPANWEIWYASWKMYTTTLLGLVHSGPGGAEVPVVDFACLEEYVENFRKLVRDFPEAWHLNVQGEDRCRGEHFNRIRRRRAIEHLEGRTPGFLPHAPWADVFREAARDKQYWDEHVRDAALKYTARGGVVWESQEVCDVIDVTQEGSRCD